METETEATAQKQREREEERPLVDPAPGLAPALPAAAREIVPRPRGRPFVKGQSGNPAGRPPRIHPPAAVAEYVLGRKAIPLAKKVRDLALSGDKTMLKLWFHHIAQSRSGAADWAGLPLLEDRAELRALRDAVAEAAEKGAITETQADALVRIVNTVMGMM